MATAATAAAEAAAAAGRFARCNALKNVLVPAANAVAAIGYALFGPVHWVAVVPLAVGGARRWVARAGRRPAVAARGARGVIAALGLALAAGLWWRA